MRVLGGLEAGLDGINLHMYHTECIIRENGQPHGIEGLETQILKRTEAGWKIAHIQYHGKDIVPAGSVG